MTTPAIVGMYGRKPALIPAGLRTLDYYAAGPLPVAPPSVAVPAVADWGMLGNDTFGDCGVAGIDHGFMTADAVLGQPVLGAPTTDVVNYYLNYTGGQDVGVVLSDFLAYVKANGFLGRRVTAYAPVAVRDVPTLHFAVEAYDFAYCGITVYDGMEQAFAAGKPWDLESVSGGVAGGHCIPVVGYDSNYLYAVTWGKIQPIAYPAWARVADEAWAIITGELSTVGNDGRGINLGALQADLSQLAHPVAPPSPSPSPDGPLAELAALVRKLAATAEKDMSRALAWLESHGL